MSHCTNCGAPIGEAIKFCEKCGNAVSATSEQPPDAEWRASNTGAAEPIVHEPMGNMHPPAKPGKKKLLISAIACAVVIAATIAIVVGINLGGPERPLTASELLDLGEKYLLELNYEQALVQFLGVIEIEPMIPRGYTGAAEAYIGLGDTGGAVAILRQGTQMLPDNTEIQAMLDELHPLEVADTSVPEPSVAPVMEPDLVPESESNPEMQLFLRSLLVAYEVGGYESIYASVETVEYQEFIAQVDVYPVIHVDDSEIYGIGLYNYGNFIYIGGYMDLQRSGHGHWLSVLNLQNYQYRFEGEWSNDLPNGTGAIETWYNRVENIDRHPEIPHVVRTETAGVFQDGYYNGSFFYVLYVHTGDVHRFSPTYVLGVGLEIPSPHPGQNNPDYTGYPIAQCHDCEDLYVGIGITSRVSGLDDS